MNNGYDHPQSVSGQRAVNQISISRLLRVAKRLNLRDRNQKIFVDLEWLAFHSFGYFYVVGQSNAKKVSASHVLLHERARCHQDQQLLDFLPKSSGVNHSGNHYKKYYR